MCNFYFWDGMLLNGWTRTRHLSDYNFRIAVNDFKHYFSLVKVLIGCISLSQIVDKCVVDASIFNNCRSWLDLQGEWNGYCPYPINYNDDINYRLTNNDNNLRLQNYFVSESSVLCYLLFLHRVETKMFDFSLHFTDRDGFKWMGFERTDPLTLER